MCVLGCYGALGILWNLSRKNRPFPPIAGAIPHRLLPPSRAEPPRVGVNPQDRRRPKRPDSRPRAIRRAMQSTRSGDYDTPMKVGVKTADSEIQTANRASRIVYIICILPGPSRIANIPSRSIFTFGSTAQCHRTVGLARPPWRCAGQPPGAACPASQPPLGDLQS